MPLFSTNKGAPPPSPSRADRSALLTPAIRPVKPIVKGGIAPKSPAKKRRVTTREAYLAGVVSVTLPVSVISFALGLIALLKRK